MKFLGGSLLSLDKIALQSCRSLDELTAYLQPLIRDRKSRLSRCTGNVDFGTRLDLWHWVRGQMVTYGIEIETVKNVGQAARGSFLD